MPRGERARMLQCAMRRCIKRQNRRIGGGDCDSFLLQSYGNHETFEAVTGNNHDAFRPIDASSWHLLADAGCNICVRIDHISALWLGNIDAILQRYLHISYAVWLYRGRSIPYMAGKDTAKGRLEVAQRTSLCRFRKEEPALGHTH